MFVQQHISYSSEQIFHETLFKACQVKKNKQKKDDQMYLWITVCFQNKYLRINYNNEPKQHDHLHNELLVLCVPQKQP